MRIGLRDLGIVLSLILFVDTGSEKPETMAYLPIMDACLLRHGMPPIRRAVSRRLGEASCH